MIFTKDDTYTSDQRVDKLTKELNTHYISCIVSLIDLLSTREDLSFAVHNLEKFSSNPSKVNYEGLVHLLGYIMDNKTLVLKHCDDTKDAPLSAMLIQANIKS